MKKNQFLAKVTLFINSPEKIAFALALLFGIISAILVPQMTVNDEGAHFIKAYSLTDGHLAGERCQFPKDILEKKESISNQLSTPNINKPLNYSETENTTCGSAGNYSPIMHTPQAIGIGLGKTLHLSADALVLMGRITNAIFYALSLYLIIRFARIGKWAFVVIGLFPLMIHTAGSLSGDVMNNVVVMAAIMIILNLFTQKTLISRKQIILLGTIAILLAITKSTNIIFLLPLVALPSRLFVANKKIKAPFNINKWLILGMCALLGVLAILISQKLLGSALFFRETVENPLKSDPLRFGYILYNTYVNPVLAYGDLLLKGTVGIFSSFKYQLPTALVFVEIIVLLIAIFHKSDSDRFINKKELAPLALFSSISLAIFVLVVTFALYSAWAIQPDRLGAGAIYADGVQGRYFTAALLLLIPIALYLQKFIWIRLKSKFTLGIIISTSSLLILSFYIAETILVYS